ncbi:protein kinase [Tumebacillus sp. DT12]|uniref:Protein kinase n=1 Tax=Tumebacillus lacus TaxID=2995335 RepID=A0ABT3X1F4_9BACL|nr:protein kinase [Tumebacillus lacus]MCX7569602.1 protein kinase [Tumebacillus lacus]
MSSDLLFRPGQTVTGLWHKRRYTVEGLLGRGANGEVYRVTDSSGQTLALKAAPLSSGLALEHKILKRLSEVARGADLGPRVFDLDDVQVGGQKQFFLVMELVRGTTLPAFLDRRGRHWTPVLLLQLCTYLERLHETGNAFGDLKAENCLVEEARGAVRLVDFGGVTPFGRGVKEYTEWYDRAWWGRGSRMAEEDYDVFALAMLAIALLAPDLRKALTESGVPNGSRLRQAVSSDARLADWRGLLQGVFDGRVRTISAFRQELLPLVKAGVRLEQKEKVRRKPRDWTDWLVVGSGLVLMLVFCQFVLFR